MKPIYLFKSILAGALFVLCVTGKAQDTIITISDTLTESFEELIIVPDSRTQVETIAEVEDTIIKKRYHSPRKAVVFSAVLPGLGQAYNKKYWKIPILYAAGAGLVIHINYLNTEYYFWKGLHDDAENGNPLPSEYRIEQKNAFYEMEKYYRRWRDFNMICLGGLYFLNIIDAMVDAYFYEYDISDDLTLKVKPSLIHNTQFSASAGLKVSLRF